MLSWTLSVVVSWCRNCRLFFFVRLPNVLNCELFLVRKIDNSNPLIVHSLRNPVIVLFSIRFWFVILPGILDLDHWDYGRHVPITGKELLKYYRTYSGPSIFLSLMEVCIVCQGSSIILLIDPLVQTLKPVTLASKWSWSKQCSQRFLNPNTLSGLSIWWISSIFWNN